jgi:sodium-dependent phosphate cotransporter
MTKVKELFYTLTHNKNPQISQWSLSIGLIGLLFAFLVMLKVAILSFSLLGAEVVAQIMVVSANPFLCLFIGLLTTALVHSSSTITAITIAIVASGTISPTSAIYMIMGANLGTTITATLVAVGHATRKKEFRKAISASMAHHFFNLFSIIIFFPIEFYTGFLTYISQGTAHWFEENIAVNVGYIFSPIDVVILPIARTLLYALGNQALLAMATSVVALFYVLQFTTKLFQKVWTNINESPLQIYLFHSPFQALVLGMLITAILQSSTVVTSLIVPIVAANKISIKRVFPFIMGANLGTTFKAIVLASSANEAAVSVAFMHFYLNLLGILVFYPLPALRSLPVNLARRMGKLTLSSRLFGFGYIMFIFFLFPFLLIFFSQKSIEIRQYNWIQDKKVALSETPKLFYKQTYQNTDLLPTQTALHLHRQGKKIWLQDDLFILDKTQPCLKGICLERVLPTYGLQHNTKKDTCYVFSKTSPKHITYFYFSQQEGLLVRREMMDLAGKTVFREDLVNVLGHQ